MMQLMFSDQALVQCSAGFETLLPNWFHLRCLQDYTLQVNQWLLHGLFGPISPTTLWILTVLLAMACHTVALNMRQ